MPQPDSASADAAIKESAKALRVNIEYAIYLPGKFWFFVAQMNEQQMGTKLTIVMLQRHRPYVGNRL
jgi:hypothetical protein